MSGRETEEIILELLTNGPSSFAALYGYVFRESRVPPSVDDVLAVLADFEARGWIRTRLLTPDGKYRPPTDLDRARARAEYRRWFDGATASEVTTDKVSNDEVGLWFDIEPSGRVEWAKDVGEEGGGPRWVIDQDDRVKIITIQAENLAMAEWVLADWRQRHPSLRILPESQMVEPVAEYRLHDGSVVKRGLRLQVEYETVTRP